MFTRVTNSAFLTNPLVLLLRMGRREDKSINYLNRRYRSGVLVITGLKDKIMV